MTDAFSPIVLVKFVLWLVVMLIGTLLLRRRRVSAGVRLGFLIGGVLLFGLVFGLLAAGGTDPNPVLSIRNLLAQVLRPRPAQAPPLQRVVLPIVGMLGLLLIASWVSNKSFCGWACPLGLLQELLARIPLPKWRPSFRLTNSVRIAAFVALVGGLALAGLDWIGWIDPFRLFSFQWTLGIGLFGGVLLVASLFVYRPWCRFLCPFGLLSWAVEQVSLLRPRINREACKNCQLCVRACPGQAMADIYAGKAVHADCFACGACIAACPRKDVLAWRSRQAADAKPAATDSPQKATARRG